MVRPLLYDSLTFLILSNVVLGECLRSLICNLKIRRAEHSAGRLWNHPKSLPECYALTKDISYFSNIL